MEAFISQIEWTPTVVSFVVAFGLGWVWYSDKLFGVKWREGVSFNSEDTSTMMPAMLSQAVGTFLLAVVIGATAANEDLIMAILVGLTISALVKANGFYSQKNRYAIMVESGYILVMVIAMICVHVLI